MDRPYVIAAAGRPAIAPPAERFVRAALSALSGREFTDLAELLAEDARIDALGGEGAGALPVVRRATAAASLRGWVGRVPDVAVTLRSAVIDADRAALELHVCGRGVADTGPMVAPLFVWLSTDETGRLDRATISFTWAERRLAIEIGATAQAPAGGTAQAPAGGTAQAPAGPGELRSQAWYRDLAERFAEAWSYDPQLAATSACSDLVTVEVAGWPELTAIGGAALAGAPAAGGRGETLRVVDVVGQQDRMAVWFSLGPAANPARPTRRVVGGGRNGAMLWWLDGNDRICTIRRFGPVGPGPGPDRPGDTGTHGAGSRITSPTTRGAARSARR
jgi:hypothetical protein